jgi:hypothetical protein
MKVTADYREYRPAGYTDDLGIIADRNQWVKEQPEGWHIFVRVKEWYDIRDWLVDNNIDYINYYSSIVLFNESDVTMFLLRWGGET